MTGQRKVQLEEMFPWEFARALADAPICYVPIGTVEWHGEHAALGLDAIKAHAVCVAVARQEGGIVTPPLYWTADSREELADGSYLTGGIELGERYHVPGNMFWLRDETYLNLLLDMYEAMRRRGFRLIVVLSGHWPQANLAVIHESGRRFLEIHPDMTWRAMTDQAVVPGHDYPFEHAAGGETSVLMALRPHLVDLSKTFETDRSLLEWYAGQPEHLQRRQETAGRYIGVATAVPDHSNDPETTASLERGQRLFGAIVVGVAARVREARGPLGRSSSG